MTSTMERSRYVLLNAAGTVHSLWTSPGRLIAYVDRLPAGTIDEERWTVAAVELDPAGTGLYPRAESVAYVRETVAADRRPLHERAGVAKIAAAVIPGDGDEFAAVFRRGEHVTEAFLMVESERDGDAPCGGSRRSISVSLEDGRDVELARALVAGTGHVVVKED